MTKQEVLEIFDNANRFIRPDAVFMQVHGFHHRSSVYSYLFRLHKQGLLHRQIIYGRIAYRITKRGMKRLQFFRNRLNPPVSQQKTFQNVPIGEKS
jgi:DNA-binding transcriptional regulator PaaX